MTERERLIERGFSPEQADNVIALEKRLRKRSSRVFRVRVTDIAANESIEVDVSAEEHQAVSAVIGYFAGKRD